MFEVNLIACAVQGGDILATTTFPHSYKTFQNTLIKKNDN